MAAVAVAEPAALTLTDLPRALALHIFSLLPVDARACAACVCRGWGAALSERSLWLRLDLSPSSGVRVLVTDAVLAGAAAKARGQLAALDVSDCDLLSFHALLATVRANGGALRELCAGARGNFLHTLDTGRVHRLLEAAPQLAACHADVLGGAAVADARRMLRNEPPFEPLRLRVLCVVFPANADEAGVCPGAGRRLGCPCVAAATGAQQRTATHAPRAGCDCARGGDTRGEKPSLFGVPPFARVCACVGTPAGRRHADGAFDYPA
jgi:hypothetical protein